MEPKRVNISDSSAKCEKCGVNILEIGNFTYSGKTESTPTFREELCTCRHCGTEFIIHYNLYDKDGHIEQRVFTGDINDPSYNWQDALTDDQKRAIAEHMRDCKVCNERLTDEILTDAWFSDIIHSSKISKNT